MSNNPRIGKPIQPPLGIELRYTKDLRGLTAECDRILRQMIRAGLPGWIEEAGVRQDGWVDSVTSAFTRAWNGILAKIHLDGSVHVRRASVETADYVSRSWTRTLQAAYGGLFSVRRPPTLAERLEAWETQNLALIEEGLRARTTRLQGVIVQAVMNGTPISQVERKVRDALGVGRGRAKMIARDQVGKLTGNLAMMNQQASGVDEYIWGTSLDDRVRPTHRTKEGKKFRWDTPPADTGHPGEDFQCRCVAKPILPVLEERLKGAA